MARLAEQQRRRRRIQAAIGGTLALILIALGTTWLLGAFDDKPTPITQPDCSWTARDPSLPGVEVTGLPPSSVPLSGVRTLVIDTNLGQIQAVVDIGSAFCAAASLDFLVGRGFYNDTRCHRLDTSLSTLTCGSRTGDDTSGPDYQFPREGLPRPVIGQASPAPTDPAADPNSYYVAGALVLTNIDQNAVGSQFMIVYGGGSALPPEYVQIGTITTGLEIVEEVTASGAVDAAGVGNPIQDLTITGMRLADETTAEPTGSATETPSEPAPSTTATS